MYYKRNSEQKSLCLLVDTVGIETPYNILV